MALRDGPVVTLLELSVRDGRMAQVDALVDPAKLTPVVAALDI